MTRIETTSAWRNQLRVELLESELQRIEREIGCLLRRVAVRPHLERGIAELRHQRRDRQIRIALIGEMKGK